MILDPKPSVIVQRRELQKELKELNQEVIKLYMDNLSDTEGQLKRLVMDYNDLANKSGINSRLALIKGEGDQVFVNDWSGLGWDNNASYSISPDDGTDRWFPSTRYC